METPARQALENVRRAGTSIGEHGLVITRINFELFEGNLLAIVRIRPTTPMADANLEAERTDVQTLATALNDVPIFEANVSRSRWIHKGPERRYQILIICPLEWIGLDLWEAVVRRWLNTPTDTESVTEETTSRRRTVIENRLGELALAPMVTHPLREAP